MTSPRCLLLCALGLAVGAAPAFGQSRTEPVVDEPEQQQQQQQASLPVQLDDRTDQPGRVAESAVGRAGQRQARDEAAPTLHPTQRISSRINNRIQSRIQNRIDRNYDPQANAANPFAVAEDKARSDMSKVPARR